MTKPYTLPPESDLLGFLLLGSITGEIVGLSHASVDRVYSQASELDADKWDEEYRLNQRIQAHNKTMDAHLGAVEDEPGNEHGSHLLEDDEDVWADENAREPEAERARRLR